MRENHPYDFWFHFVAKDKKGMMAQRDNKNRSVNFCYKEFGFKKEHYVSNHTRGIYFSRLYKKTDAFLRGEIKETELEPAFDNSVEALTNYWRFGKIGDTEKGASNRNSMMKGRLRKLLKEKRFPKSERPEWYRVDAYRTFAEMRARRSVDIGR